MFVLLLVTGLSLPWIITSYNKRQTIKVVESLNGVALSRYRFAGGRIQFGPLENVYFLGPQVADCNLQVLQKVPGLRILNLTNTQVTDDGLAQLRDFTDLNCLYIANIDLTQIVGPGAAHRNSTSQITGKGLSELKDLPNLHVVQLIGTLTRDEDLQYLKFLSRLVLLDLKDTKITDAGVAELKKALPNCKIVRR